MIREILNGKITLEDDRTPREIGPGITMTRHTHTVQIPLMERIIVGVFVLMGVMTAGSAIATAVIGYRLVREYFGG